MNAIIPIPQIPISIRVATIDDLPFIDGLQQKHSKQVGFLQTKALEGKIKAGHVLVAEEGSGFGGQGSGNTNASSILPPSSLNPEPRPLNPVPVGYLIGNDQYFKHDDIGIIYQINIAERHRRSLVAATLLKAQFERSAYGCKLYCCWCAQDLDANRFWEAMGFVPLAFRAGSEKKARVHIFWQKRIREGDDTTPWWFPSQTTGGSIREDRLVFPIPPGMRWSNEMPRILPREDAGNPNVEDRNTRQIANQKSIATTRERVPRSKIANEPKPVRPTLPGLQFTVAPAPAAVKEKPRREKRKVAKNDPRLVAAARELRDRWLERVNSGALQLEGQGKYQINRAFAAGEISAVKQIAGDDAIRSLPLEMAA